MSRFSSFSRSSLRSLAPARSAALGGFLLCLAISACEDEEPSPADNGEQIEDAGRDARVVDGAGPAKVDAGPAAKDDASVTSSGDAGAAGTARIGDFSLQMVAPVAVSDTPGFTALLGKVFDAPTAETTIWEEQDEEEGCVLLTPRIPVCIETKCTNSTICVEDNQCRKSPTAISVGTLSVTGVKTGAGATMFTSEPNKNTYQAPVTAQLPYVPFAEGDPIEFALAGGGGVGPFTLEASGIAPLTLSTEGAYMLEKGKPLALAWTPASSGSSQIYVKLDISHHGGAKGKIECHVPDNGALTISAAMVGELIDLGVAGFPTVVIQRESIGSSTTELGRIDLKIYTYVEREIKLPGLVSCSGKEDCASDQNCREDKTCG